MTRPRLVLAAALCLACAATAATAVLLDAAQSPEPVAAEFTHPVAGWPPQPVPPVLDSADVPVSVLPSPTGTTLPDVPAEDAPSPPGNSPTATRTTAGPPATTRPATPAPVSLTVGSTVGLEAADRSGHRVRHRDYRGRLEPIRRGGGPDAAFRVRSGLADNGCVSLESVNFPGYYLRHRNFEIRLDRNDGSALFRQDSTFCAVTIRQGAALALRSENYPDHHVAADGEWLKIVRTSASRATAFVPRAPL
ncbi:AbfB domain-containing protein [Actinoplanes sp. NPDC023801]|uniref:AbfB domain-containing protein n=1 Tax=Actinoplanes sp. NPDC023801 TaxID=3154595 RepID=UPI0033FEF238